METVGASFSLSNKEAKILVADDMSLSRVSIKRLLRDLGFNSVELAENGKKAWELLLEFNKNNTPFSLVLSDWMMPELNGVELFKNIQASGWASLPPMILITAETDSLQVAEALKLGVSGYLRKPVTLEALREALSALSKPANREKS